MRAQSLLAVALFAVSSFIAASTLPAPAQEAYRNPETADQAIRYEAVLERSEPRASGSVTELEAQAREAVARGDAQGAADALSAAAVAEPGNWRVWRDLSRALAAITSDDWEVRSRAQTDASAAAFIAYQRASEPRERASALAALGESFAIRFVFRPALDAYAASLDLFADAEIETVYLAMRAEHGFRVLDNTVDSDAASPRACIQFSENLAPELRDFEPYVSVDGGSGLAVTAEAQQVCIDGLAHGETYRVTLREGLPSAVGESLTAAVPVTIYVRDRSPAVRFPGRNYVLPRNGQNGVPVVSVNTEALALDLLRVGDRGLGPVVAGGEFRRQLTGYEAEEIASGSGQRVWSGEMPVTRRLNEEVTTAFPVSEAAGALEPGVYALVARPAEGVAEDWTQRATQWFVVSDLGLSALTGQDGVHVFLRSLGSAEPVVDATLALVARNGEILGQATSDAQGYARFDAGLARGAGGAAPALVTAEAAEDYAFIDLTQSAFDLTDRGVAGREPPGPLDALTFTERGVYRPGETVHLTALLRDARGAAVPGTPLTVLFERPDGVEQSRAIAPDEGEGGRVVDLALLDSAMTGTWRARVHADPAGEPVGEATFLVEDFVPDRLVVELEPQSATIAPDAPAEIAVDGRYLYGAPGAGLALSGEITVAPDTEGLPAFPGYVFGLTDEEVTPVRAPLPGLPTTDDSGTAIVSVALPDLPATTRPLRATVSLTLSEPGGRGVEQEVTLPVRSEAPQIGVRPLFTDNRVAESENARFEVIGVDAAGGRTALPGLTWELYALETSYQWYNRDGYWNYESVELTRRVADGRMDAAPGVPGEIAAPVDWGRYRLDVMSADPNGPATSVTFEAGFQGSATAETPDALDVALDARGYAPGDTMRVSLSPRFAGKATVAVVGERLFDSQVVDVADGGGDVSLTVGEDWGAGAYVLVMLHRPLDVQAGRMPQRAIGLAWASVEATPHTLDVTLDSPPSGTPRETLAMPVRIDGIAPGADAYFVAAAVDVGILNLTGFESPDPAEWYFGQRRLGSELRDLYGQLIDGMHASRGRLRTGGDVAPAQLLARPPVNEPVALFQGVTRVGADGTAQLSFDVPAFNGTLRIMAIAWSGDQVGRAETDVVVRDPLVATATVPRFLTKGDESALRLDLANVDGASGTYSVDFTFEGAVSADFADTTQEIALAAGESGTVTLPLTATAAGEARIDAVIRAPNGEEFTQAYALDVTPGGPPVTRRTVTPLAENGNVTLSGDLAAGFEPGSAQVSISISPSAALDVPGLLLSLDRYPYGCGEQITSRAMPLLYVDDLAQESELALDASARQRIEDAIAQLTAKQDSGGSFGLWSVGSGDLWLDSYVTDFLTRAVEKGFAVPERVFEAALARLENGIAYAPEIEENGGADVAYAAYVLARNGAGAIGDLRYYADVKLDAFATPLARAQIAASLAMLGDATRAEAAMLSALTLMDASAERPSREDYGSALRDGAATIALAAENGLATPRLIRATAVLEGLRARSQRLSTQENAWLVLAAHGLQGRAADMRLGVDGAPHAGPLFRSYDAEALAGQPVTITNDGAAVSATITVTGYPDAPEPAASQGFAIERSYYTIEGVQTSPEQVAQGDRLVVVLSVTEAVPERGRVLLVDYLPAGFEIDNPRLVDSGNLDTMPWLTQEGAPVHSEFRDDRFVAAFERFEDSPVTVSTAYMVRAVSPGSYTHPPALVEDMYRPDRFARTEAGLVTVGTR